MNQIENLKELKNRYFGMRHGEAESNVAHILASDPKDALSGYGLTNNGRAMVKESAEKFEVVSNLVIIYSDFLRTTQTAQIVTDVIKPFELLPSEELRERYFGKYDQGPDTHYEDIWTEDNKNPNSEAHQVESAEDVTKRVTGLILDLESKYKDKNILLVSHGDPLQFLETAFAKVPVFEHQKYPLFELAEIKELKMSK